MIDTGVDIGHPDLAANMWTNAGEIPGNSIDDDGNGYVDDVNGWNFYDNDNNVYVSAEDDHGTHVSGTIAARTDNGTGVAGINWYAHIMPLKFLGGADGSGYTSDAVLAVEYAAAQGAQIVNASWGGGGFSQALYDAIEAANLLFVAAAGNDLLDNDITPHYPSSYDLPNIVSVAAIDHFGDLATGWGTLGDLGSNWGATSVDLAAPGDVILSTYPDSQYAYFSGTSMATPHVTGVAALVLAANPSLTPVEVRDVLFSSAVPLASLAGNTVTGGLLNAHQAVIAATPTPCSLDEDCDDGAWCNGSEACDAGTCTAGTPVACDDGIGCTTDFCDESADACAATPTYPACGDPPLLFAIKATSTTLPGGLAVNDIDLVTFDSATATYAIYFDGSDVGIPSAAEIDAFFETADGDLLISLAASVSIAGLTGGPNGTSVDDSDILRFVPTSLGADTAGAFEFYFDGSDVALTRNGEDIDALAVLDDGRLLVSTRGSFSVSGASGADEDILEFTPSSLGASTSGSWSTYFDGSDVGLSASSSGDIDGVHVDTDGSLLLSTTGSISLSGLSPADEDVFRFVPSTLGTTTAGSFSEYFDASDQGIAGQDIGAVGVAEPSGCSSDGECDDGLWCNGAETCDAGACVAGTAVVCDDGVACTTDFCDEDADACDATGDDGLCDNGLFCDGAETCDLALGCQVGTAVTCDDGVGCTSDFCDESADACDATADHSACDDGLYCDGAEVCDPILGCQEGTAPCDDGVDCTIDTCDEGADSCGATANDAYCDNGAYCDGAETCDLTLGCQAGTAVTCDDGVGCTADFCDESADSCDATADHGACDDGIYCDGAEVCDLSLDCQEGTAPCDDGIECTVDTCDEVADSCGATADDGFCDNGLYCDGTETCDLALGCQAGTSVTCTDGVDCTVDFCDETADACDVAPDDAWCDNGVFCDGGETCHESNGCQTGAAPDCSGSADQCNAGVCDATLDDCAPEPLSEGTACDDADECTDDDVCDGAGSCGGVQACLAPTIYFSFTTNATLPGGVTVADEDVVAFDQVTGTWSLYFDGSDVGLGNDVDAVHGDTDGSLLLSVKGALTVPDIGAIDDSDVFRFVPTSLGATTAGTFEWVIDGSDLGLTRNGEDIDGVHVLADGRYLLSTTGRHSASGVSGSDEDLLAFTPTSLGSTTAGTLETWFDGSDVGLTDSGEDVWGVFVDDLGDIYLVTAGTASFAGASGEDEDVFQFVPTSLGTSTSGDAVLYLDGTLEGIPSGEDIDALWMEF